MIVNIKDVKACRNKAYGNFLLRGHDYALITISQRLNKTVAEYGATLLHELLHLWITILRIKGFRTTNIKEHRFIYAAEDVILKMARKHLRRKPL